MATAVIADAVRTPRQGDHGRQRCPDVDGRGHRSNSSPVDDGTAALLVTSVKRLRVSG